MDRSRLSTCHVFEISHTLDNDRCGGAEFGLKDARSSVPQTAVSSRQGIRAGTSHVSVTEATSGTKCCYTLDSLVMASRLPACSRSRYFWIFPVPVFGSVQYTILAGHL